METRLVQAEEPTVLSDQEYYDLRPTDMFPVQTPTAHVVEGDIDFDRFCQAVAKTLQVYPLYAGRFELPSEPEGIWRVRLSNAGMPVSVKESDDKTVTPTDTVIQIPLTVVDRSDAEKFRLVCRDAAAAEPPARLLVTRFTSIGHTSIGFIGSHILGDGFTIYRFLRLLSQNYQRLPPLDTAPSYTARLPSDDPAPQKHTIAWIPELEQNYARGAPPPAAPQAPPLTFRLRPDQIAAVRAAVVHADPEGCARVSRQDAVAALLAECVTIADGDAPPVTMVSNIVSCRGIADYNAPCNGIFFSLSGVGDRGLRLPMSTIAKQMREALLRLRNTEYLTDYHHALRERFHRGTARDEMFDFSPPPGGLVVNSTWKFDWTSAHFGFPESCRFYHTMFPKPRMVKMFTPNPTRNQDGTWTSYPGWAEIAITLQPHLKDAFIQAIRRELAAKPARVRVGLGGAILCSLP